MIQRFNAQVLKARFFEHANCQFLAPAGAETFAVLGQRHSHAMHRADRVKKRTQRMFDVLFQIAGRTDVLHQERAARLQRCVDVVQHRRRGLLVVHNVKPRDQVKPIVFAKARHIPHFKRHVIEAATSDFFICRSDRLFA